MANVLLLHDEGVDWSLRVTRWLVRDHAAHCGSVAEIDAIAEQPGQFDLSVVAIGALDHARARIGPARLGSIIAIADHDDEAGRVSALDSGVADCVSPVVSGRELRARINGILHRRLGIAPGRQPRQRPTGRWHIDLSSRYLRGPDGKRVHLPPATFRLLIALAERPQRALTREFLAGALNGNRTEARTIDVRVSRLRQILTDKDPAAAGVIETVRNEGYRLACRTMRDGNGLIVLDTSQRD